MSVHARPICWKCEQRIDSDVVYAAPCDHEECPSVCFHGLCLMEWREQRDRQRQAFKEWVEHMREHGHVHPDAR